jgi:cardiolipin synthase
MDRQHRVLSLPGGEELGRAAPGALATFPADAMERATGSNRIEGNALRLQFEGSSTFDAWIEAIANAKRFVYFENYILRDDRVGRAFRDALMDKALEGVPVRLIHDWVGCWATPRRYWHPFRQAGVEVRAFNRPRVQDPFGVFQRDHRKLVCVDGEVAFVGGFCVGVEWAGSAEQPPWRDTGVEVQGPAAMVAGRAFERIWSEIGDPMPESLCGEPDTVRARGDTPVWIIEGEPGRSRVFRTLSLVAAHATSRLWITDPYFVAPRPVSEALAAAARDGVDVRVLVPGHNNWPWVGSLSRGGYRFLMESGVRLFEWQGPMIHAKTSVSDGIWSRVGSSNLNSWSLLGNWEMDVGVLDESLAAQLEALFLADLASAVEIVLPRAQVSLHVDPEEALQKPRDEVLRGEPPKASLDPQGSLTQRLERQLRSGAGTKGGSVSRRIAALARAGSVFGTAIAGHRRLGREDRTVLGTVSVAVIISAVLFAVFPTVVGWALAVVLAWFGAVMATRALIQARRARREEAENP